MIKSIIGLLLFILVCVGCQTDTSKDKLIVAAAASTQFAVRQLAIDFEKAHKIPVEVIIGSSGKITAQIINGAPFDVFISANTFYPEALEKENKIIGKPFSYGAGIPVIWSLDSILKLENLSEVFLSTEIKKIALANPKNAPYGKQAENYLKAKGIYEQVKHKLVYGESISQVNEYILSRSVQVGFSAKSILLSKKLKGQGAYKLLENEFHIEQAMVLIKNAKNDNAKKLFLQFVKSEKGRGILKEYGLL